MSRKDATAGSTVFELHACRGPDGPGHRGSEREGPTQSASASPQGKRPLSGVLTGPGRDKEHPETSPPDGGGLIINSDEKRLPLRWEGLQILVRLG